MNPVKSIKIKAIVTVLRTPCIILVALLPGLLAFGQVKFTTITSSQELGRADYLQVEFVVENAKQIDQLTPPNFPGFQVIQGPIQSSGMSIINGNMSQYKALSFVLQPAKTGKFTIQGAVAMVDGKRMSSNSVTVTVIPGSSANSSGGNNNSAGSNNSGINGFFPPSIWPEPDARNPMDIEREYVLKPGENIKEKIHKNLFVKVQVDKINCYVGEPIVATYKLYSRLSSESRVTRRPSLNGFSVYDMVDPASDVTSVEKLNGKPFVVHIIRKTQLIPLQAGTIDLDPVEVENTVHFVRGGNKQENRSGNSLKDLFDQLSDENMMGPEIEEKVTLNTKPVTISVKPLPEANKPAGFNGAVGSFTVQAALARKDLAAQDEATLRVVVKGKGNLPVINAPQVQWPAGINAFDPSAREDINKTAVPMSGSKTFDYTFTPSAPGSYTIPAIDFSYFDPSSGTYKKAGTPSLDFQVAPAVKKGNAPSGHNTLASARPPAQQETTSVTRFVRQYLEWIFAVLILTGIAFFLWRQNSRQKKGEEEEKRNEPASLPDNDALAASLRSVPSLGSVTDPLQDARKLFYDGDYSGYYREVNRAVWKAVAARLDLPASEMNKYNIARQLEARGWDTSTVLSLENILEECEMNLYTPVHDTHNMQQLLNQAESLLARLA